MKKMCLICDMCGETVDNLYTINFKATEDSEGGDFYLPDVEVCEDCVDVICNHLKHYIFGYDEDEVVFCDDECDDCELAQVCPEAYGDKCDVDASICAEYDSCNECPYDNYNKNHAIPDLEDCNDIETGDSPFGEENLNAALDRLKQLTDNFYNATSVPAQKPEVSAPKKNNPFEMSEDELFDSIQWSIKVNGTDIKIDEAARRKIFSTLYSFSKKEYPNDAERKAELYGYLDGLNEDEQKFATLCSYAMMTHDSITKGIMPFLGLMGLAH